MEKEIIKNALSLSTLAPDKFAYEIMQGPGFMARVISEGIYVIKCVPTEIKTRTTEECYEELPIIHHGVNRFLTPMTRIIREHGTQFTCSQIMPPLFNVDGTWFKMLPKPTETEQPTKLRLTKGKPWRFSEPGALATSGVYTTKDLDRLRRSIIFPVDRPAVLNNIARGITGEQIKQYGLLNILSMEEIRKFARQACTTIWEDITSFGTVSAGIIGVLMICHIIGKMTDGLCNGYMLYEVFGWSFKLIATLSGALTQIFLKKENKKRKNKRQEQRKNRKKLRKNNKRESSIYISQSE